MWAGNEECDDGNGSNTDACLTTCFDAECGDGFVWAGQEPCDDGNGSNNDACLNACEAADCGDGFTWAGQEACDDANANNDDGCTMMCALPACGDGYLQPNAGEACDDANQVNTDACVACDLAECGDGFVWAGQEPCDDGNANDGDACLVGCVPASCGDGFTWMGQEGCDDGNVNNNDGCTNACVLPSCGDGFVWGGQEACDDGNMSNNDACLDTCQVASCQDGFVHTGVEICDQANANAGDGCEPDCTRTPIIDLCTGEGHTCIVFEGGQLRCWGWNQWGQLGLGHTNNIGDGPGEMPPPAVNAGGQVVDVECGHRRTCAIHADNTLRCWGDNPSGQLGYGNTTRIGDGPGEMPPAAINIGGPVQQISIGTGSSCVLLMDGTVRCMGQGNQLGYGNANNIGDGPGEMPPAAVNLGGLAVQIASGGGHSCALLQSGAVRCWGLNSQGQLGIGSTTAIGDGPGEMPPANTNVGAGVVAMLNAGASSTCVLFQGGVVRCWGDTDLGQIGQPGDDIGNAPGEMPPANLNYGNSVAIDIDGGVQRSVRVDSGWLRVWGNEARYSYEGTTSFNIGDEVNEMPPGNVDHGAGPIMVHGHGSHSWHHCVVLQDWSVHCWGRGDLGQLGYGDTNDLGAFPGQLPTPAVQTF